MENTNMPPKTQKRKMGSRRSQKSGEWQGLHPETKADLRKNEARIEAKEEKLVALLVDETKSPITEKRARRMLFEFAQLYSNVRLTQLFESLPPEDVPAGWRAAHGL